jgi:Family of unknown function (DUF5681)
VAQRKKSDIKSSSSKNDYEIGYRKPPKHSQFQPGQSGNPAGRRKGLRNFKTDVVSTLAMPLKVKEGGRTRTRSTQEAALMMIRNKACQGHDPSLKCLFELAQRFNSDADETGSDQALSTEDETILDAYRAEVLADAAMTPPPTTEPSDDPPPRRSSNKKTIK